MSRQRLAAEQSSGLGSCVFFWYVLRRPYGDGDGGHARASAANRGKHGEGQDLRDGAANIPGLRAAGLIVALSAPLGGAEYMSAGRRQPRQRVCETTCLDIVGLAAVRGDRHPRIRVLALASNWSSESQPKALSSFLIWAGMHGLV